jgi:hypothetical protein
VEAVEAMEYPKFSFRIAPEIGTKLEEEATNRELTTSKLVREIVTTHCAKSAPAETRNGESAASEADADRRFQQLIFEISKTRSAVLRIGLQTIPEKTMEQILAGATDDAKGYAARVATAMKELTAEPGEQSRASGS